MTIGASIFLIAVGAILKYAVDVTVQGVEIQTIGVILMIAGAVGLLIGLFLLTQSRREVVYDDRDRAHRDRDPVVR
jgi:phosphate/sulfate permease